MSVAAAVAELPVPRAAESARGQVVPDRDQSQLRLELQPGPLAGVHALSPRQRRSNGSILRPQAQPKHAISREADKAMALAYSSAYYGMAPGAGIAFPASLLISNAILL